jgi:predicted ATPase
MVVGAFVSSLEHTEEGIALYDVHPQPALYVLQDPKISCLIYGAASLMYLGYLDRAERQNQEALTLAQQRSHPYSLVWSQCHAAILANVRGESQLAQEYAETVITHATEQRFAFWIAFGTIQRGIALMRQEQTKEGLQQIFQGVSSYRATEAILGLPQCLAFLAEAYGKNDQPEEGIKFLVEAMVQIRQTGERFYEAEIWRLKGELLLQRTPAEAAEAEACFQQALEVACHQQTKLLELRTATSLAKFW